MIDIMLEVDPSLASGLIIDKNGNLVLIVVISKALYGCVKSSLFWYNLYSRVLKGLGFVLNPVEPCMANAMIEGKQCTIGWYVDDNKISHVYS